MAGFDLSKLSVAIDLGSSVVKGAIGFVGNDGKFVCVTTDKVESQGSITHGNVKNISGAASCVKSLMQLLTNRLSNILKKEQLFPEDHHLSFEKIYVCVSGSYTQGVFKRIERNLPRIEVTEDLIREMREENENFARSEKYGKSLDFLMTIPQRYFLDGFEEEKPVGCICSHLIAEFQNILVQHDLISNVKLCFERAGYPNIEICFAPLMMANSVLSDQERYEGTALVDFGAETSSVSVFKDGIMKYVFVLHKGSERITDDLKELKIPADSAKIIKHHASAMAGVDDPVFFDLQIYNEKRTFESEMIAQIVGHRMDKILQQVDEIIQLTPAGRAINQIVLVGGGSNLKYMREKVEEYTGVPTRMGSFIDLKESRQILPFTAVLGTLYNANGCSVSFVKNEVKVEEPVVTPTAKPAKKNGRLTDRLKNKMGSFMENMFSDPSANENDRME